MNKMKKIVALQVVFLLFSASPVLASDLPRNWVHPPTWADEFEELFDSPGPWSEVVSKSQVFGFFIGTPYKNSIEEMKRKVDFLKDHNLSISVEGGGTLGWSHLCEPKDQNGERSADIELKRIQTIYDAGGKVSYLSLDGPVARLIEGGKGECSFTEKEALGELIDYIRIVKSEHPGINIGLITNFPQWSYDQYTSFRQKPGWGDYKQVLNNIFESLRSQNLEIDYVVADNPYNYVDMDYKEGDGIDRILALEQQVKSEGIAFGLVYNSEAFRLDGGHQRFHEETQAFIDEYQSRGGDPDIRIIESWYRDHVNIIPENEKYTFMNTVRDGQDLFNYKPTRGSLDFVDCSRLGGWARDPNFPGEAISVHVYKGASAGQGGQFVGSEIADLNRADLPFDDKNHGFSIPLPEQFKTGQNEKVYIYAISKQDGNNPLLNNAPQTVNCSIAIPTPTLVPTAIPTATLTTTRTPAPTNTATPKPTPNYSNYFLNWGMDDPNYDLNKDGVVNGIDFGMIVNE